MPRHREQRGQRYEIEQTVSKRRQEGKWSHELARVRLRNWRPDDFEESEEFDEFDSTRYERILSRKERARRRVVSKTEALAELKEEEERFEELVQAAAPAAQQGTVLQINGDGCRVRMGEHSLTCEAPGFLQAAETNPDTVVVIGDEVSLTLNDSDHALIESILPRRSLLAWPGLSAGQNGQLLVANANQLLIVISWRDPHPQFDLLDRYLIAAAQNKLTPLICLNKIDLYSDKGAYQASLKPYRDLGYSLIFSSARSGHGVDELRKALRGKTTVVVGPANTGKSTLLEAIQPGLSHPPYEPGQPEPGGSDGTPIVSLQPLEIGGFVVDTQGNGNLYLRGLRQKDLALFYPEIAPLVHQCRFGDCSHTHEPGCAVKLAVQQDRISNRRYHNYKKIYASLPA